MNPANTLIAIPSHDGRLLTQAVGTLLECRDLYKTVVFRNHQSNIALARNELVHGFMHQTNCAQLVMIDSDMGFSRQDLEFLLSGDDALVCAEYARKVPTRDTCRFGLGFARVHRRVFQALIDFQSSEGDDVLQRYYAQGAIHVDFFPTGAMPDNRYLTEDQSFWTYCQMAGFIPRIETRTRLIHWGVASYEYVPPDFGKADISIN